MAVKFKIIVQFYISKLLRLLLFRPFGFKTFSTFFPTDQESYFFRFLWLSYSKIIEFKKAVMVFLGIKMSSGMITVYKGGVLAFENAPQLNIIDRSALAALRILF